MSGKLGYVKYLPFPLIVKGSPVLLAIGPLPIKYMSPFSSR